MKVTNVIFLVKQGRNSSNPVISPLIVFCDIAHRSIGNDSGEMPVSGK